MHSVVVEIQKKSNSSMVATQMLMFHTNTLPFFWKMMPVCKQLHKWVKISKHIYYYGIIVTALLQEYRSGQMLTGELKSELISVLQKLVRTHQDCRADITDQLVQEFMTPHPLNF